MKLFVLTERRKFALGPRDIQILGIAPWTTFTKGKSNFDSETATESLTIYEIDCIGGSGNIQRLFVS